MMARSRRTPSLPKIHDRQARDLPINSDVAAAEVDDPYERGEKITVIRSIRDDPLARLYIRSQIDTAQFSAGRKYQKLYQLVESGAKAIDFTREKVDGGKFADPLTDERADAAKQLAEAYRLMGMLNSAVVLAVLGRGLMVRQFAIECGASTQRQFEKYGRRFTDGLETLAEIWGYAPRRRN